MKVRLDGPRYSEVDEPAARAAAVFASVFWNGVSRANPQVVAAYHQGTVWPWLTGPFLTAYLEVNGIPPNLAGKR